MYTYSTLHLVTDHLLYTRMHENEYMFYQDISSVLSVAKLR